MPKMKTRYFEELSIKLSHHTLLFVTLSYCLALILVYDICIIVKYYLLKYNIFKCQSTNKNYRMQSSRRCRNFLFFNIFFKELLITFILGNRIRWSWYGNAHIYTAYLVTVARITVIPTLLTMMSNTIIYHTLRLLSICMLSGNVRTVCQKMAWY